jgi:hypothetical protein
MSLGANGAAEAARRGGTPVPATPASEPPPAPEQPRARRKVRLEELGKRGLKAARAKFGDNVRDLQSDAGTTVKKPPKWQGGHAAAELERRFGIKTAKRDRFKHLGTRRNDP